MTDDADLEVELVRAGRSLVVDPVPDDLAARVLTAIGPAAATPRRRMPGWWRWLRARRRRLLAAVLVAVLVAAALTPPVRAAVVEWLRIGGVVIRTGAPPASWPPASGPASAPAGAREMTLEQARADVGFPIGVPAALGPPERVTVTDDKRVVGMDWTVDGRPVHLDQLDGTLSWVFLKRTWSSVTPTEVDGADAAWLADSHEIAYLDRTGAERRETARLSGPCLVWQPQVGGRRTTARLEGVGELDAARSVAETVR